MTGLEIIRAPGTTVDQIADIIAEHCPPVTHEHCDERSCRECWLEWMASDKSEQQAHPPPKVGAEPCSHPRMMELSSIMRKWQQKNSAPLSALKICLEAFLAEERKRLLISRPYQERQGYSAEPD